MALVSLNLTPSDKQLKEFGEITLCMLNIIGLVLIKVADLPVKNFIIFCICGVIVFIISRINVRLVRPIYICLITLTFPIGWVVSHVLMAIFYYLVIGGTGLIFKLLRRDPLNRRYDPQATTYWTPRKQARTPQHYFNQF